jgi:hypothetical protein
LLLDEASEQEDPPTPIPVPFPESSTSLQGREVPSLARVARLEYPKVGNAQEEDTTQGTFSPLEAEFERVQMIPTVQDYTEGAAVGISENERKALWRLFWLCAGCAFLANASIMVILFHFEIGGLWPMIIAAFPSFLIWSKLAASIEKYKEFTRISYPETYFVLAIGSIIGLLGLLLMLISFWIHIRRIPISKCSGVEELGMHSRPDPVKSRKKPKTDIDDHPIVVGLAMIIFMVFNLFVIADIPIVIELLSKGRIVGAVLNMGLIASIYYVAYVYYKRALARKIRRERMKP